MAEARPSMQPEDLVTRLGIAGELPHLEEALTHPSFSNEARQSSAVVATRPPNGARGSGSHEPRLHVFASAR